MADDDRPAIVYDTCPNCGHGTFVVHCSSPLCSWLVCRTPDCRTTWCYETEASSRRPPKGAR